MSTYSYTGYCVVVFSAASLQQYIFQSNRLKENIGASYLAKRSLEKDLVETIKRSTYSFSAEGWKTCIDNMSNINGSESDSDVQIDKNVDVELIYVGGGNAALLCKNRKIATDIVKKWSRWLLNTAPGLRVIVGYGDVKGSLASAYRTALDDLIRCEEALPFGATLARLPVVRNCPSTGLAASRQTQETFERRNPYISEHAISKRQASDQNDTTHEISSVLKTGQRLPFNLKRI